MDEAIDWTTGWTVDLPRVRALIADPGTGDPEELACLAADHEVARFVIAELVEERDDAMADAAWLRGEHRVLRRAVEAAAELLAATTGEDRDTLLLAIGARPEWLPAHPHDLGCDACGPPPADDVPF
jgi:hypothetical protein